MYIFFAKRGGNTDGGGDGVAGENKRGEMAKLLFFLFDKSLFGGGDGSENKQVSVLLSASVQRFFVSRMRDF